MRQPEDSVMALGTKDSYRVQVTEDIVCCSSVNYNIYTVYHVQPCALTCTPYLHVTRCVQISSTLKNELPANLDGAPYITQPLDNPKTSVKCSPDPNQRRSNIMLGRVNPRGDRHCVVSMTTYAAWLLWQQTLRSCYDLHKRDALLQ